MGPAIPGQCHPEESRDPMIRMLPNVSMTSRSITDVVILSVQRSGTAEGCVDKKGYFDRLNMTNAVILKKFS
jgi:hypothetical protein